MRTFNLYSTYWVMALVLVGFLLSGLVGYRFYVQESETISSDFTGDVDVTAAAIERELLFNLEVLYAVKGLFDSSIEVSAAEFSKLAGSFLVRHHDIQALEWIPRVTQANRSDYEIARRVDYPDFEITERQSQGSMLRATKRSEYFPVYYLEPMKGNDVAFGFDLGSNEKRLQTLAKSRDLDLPLATASITLVQETANQRGFLIFMPVYDGEPTTIVKRREQLQGFVLGVYRIGDIVDNAIKHSGTYGINLTLVDNTGINAERLYDYALDTKLQHQTSFSYNKSLGRFCGRQWTLIASPSAGYIAARRTFLPFFSAAFCALFVSFGGAYLFAVIRFSAIIKEEVALRTEDIQATKLVLEELSQTDALTSTANRRRFDELFENEWYRGVRDGTTLALFFVDIDNFKLFNDHYGHLAGDQCIKDVAKELRNSMNRPSDLVARYGGETFVILMPSTTEAERLAQICRANIEQLHISHAYSSASQYVTISLGVISGVPKQTSSAAAFIAQADALLNKAKHSGKNRVCSAVYPEAISPSEVVNFKSHHSHSVD